MLSTNVVPSHAEHITMTETTPQMPNTFQLPPDARLVRRSAQELGLQITIHEGHAAFIRDYVLGDRFGAGGFGHVHLARRISDNRVVVVKEIRSDRVPCWCQLDEKLMPIEVVLLAMCQGIPGIVRFFDAYNLGQSWILVMDRTSESTCDMFDYIGKRGTLPEPETAHYFHQLIGILLSCHEAGVLHRDIKDENILLNRNTNELVLIDFGSGAFLESRLYTDFDGTRVYCPPEWILTNSYNGKQAEVWSLGVLLYDMLCGDIPFLSDKSITSGKLRYRKDNLSKAAKDLIGSCLNMDPEKRPSLMEILKHPWMARNRPTWNDKQPGALLVALRALERATFEMVSPFSEFSASTHSQLPLAYQLVSQHPNSREPIAFCSSHSSYSSSSSPTFDNELNRSSSQGLTQPMSSAQARSKAIASGATSSGSEPNPPHVQLTTTAYFDSGPIVTETSVTPRLAFPTSVSASSPNTTHVLWSNGLDPQSTLKLSPSLQTVHLASDALHKVICQSATPVIVSPCSRLHSNESGSSSGYYSRSDSLSSNEGHHLMTTTIINASHTCSTSSHANSVMSISNVVMAPCSTTVFTAHSVPQVFRDAASNTHCWRSGNAYFISSSSSASSSSSLQSDKSTPPGSHSADKFPVTSSSSQEQRSSQAFSNTDPNALISFSALTPCRKNVAGLYCSSSASTATSTTNSATTSYSISSMNSISQPILPSISDEVDRLYQFLTPSAAAKLRLSADPLQLRAWFAANSHTTRG